MLIIAASLMLMFAYLFENFAKIKFLGHPLAFCCVYLWARAPEQRNVRMSLLGLFPFNAPFLPWILLLCSILLGSPVETDFLGIIVGHIYYFFDQVYPQVASIRGWYLKKIIVTPSILHYFFNTNRGVNGVRIEEMPLNLNPINDNNNNNVDNNIVEDNNNNVAHAHND